MIVHLKLSQNLWKPVECGLSIDHVQDYTSDPKYVTCKKCLKLINPERDHEVMEIIQAEYNLFSR